tara:strand:+ start:1748 stop:2290 length:543 start_codon:yes stop_codon:yes gene_type:complete
MEIKELPFAGLFLINSFFANDERGSFVKNFHKDKFNSHGIDFELRELFYSESKKDVIRGMHFQTPPHEHSKIIFPMKGSILDVVVDLRKDSDSFGKYHVEEISYKDNKALYIPEGFAHGFLSLENDTRMVYLVNKEHSPNNDSGIRWDSFGFKWPCIKPLISNRDMSFNALDQIMPLNLF